MSQRKNIVYEVGNKVKEWVISQKMPPKCSEGSRIDENLQVSRDNIAGCFICLKYTDR